MRFLPMTIVLLTALSSHAYTSKEPYSVCTAISQQNSSNGQACVSTVANAQFVEASGAGICYSIIQSGGASANALLCMQNVANAYVQEHAAQVCGESAERGGNSANVAECARTVANKYFDINASNFCLEKARNGSSSANVVTCMAGIAQSNPPPTQQRCLSRTTILDELVRAERALTRDSRDRGLRIISRLIDDLSNERNCQ